MSQSGTYKQYTRTQRNIVLEETFKGGMQTDDIPLSDGMYKHLVNFKILEDGKQLVPRRGKVRDTIFKDDVSSACTLAIPPIETTTLGIYNVRYDKYDGASDVDEELIDAIRKFIIACPNEKMAERDVDPDSLYHNASQFMSDGKELDCYYMSAATTPMFLASTEAINPVAPSTSESSYINNNFCKVVAGPYNKEINDARIRVLSELDMFRPLPRLVGTQLNNCMYTMGCIPASGGDPETRNLVRIIPCPHTDSAEHLRTYDVEAVIPKEIDPVYAYAYGFNMLSDTPYTFTNRALTEWQLNGLLPYEDAECTKLTFNYATGERIWFKTYFDYISGDTVDYRVWKRTESEESWTLIDFGALTDTSDLVVDFAVPAEAFSIRVTLYSQTETIIDPDTGDSIPLTISSNDYSFTGGEETESVYGTTKGIDPIEYDLTTAIGMINWKQRIVLWGVEKAPDMIFCSDINNPTYFPYPNGCEQYPDNILHVCIFMDALMIFTTENIYKTTLNDDGTFKTEVVVTDVNITYEDTYSIVPVKNMLFYKSDNYYYMLVPSHKALTFGEFNVAPVSKSVNHLLDHMDTELKQVLLDMYSEEWGYPSIEELELTPNTYQVYLSNDEVCIDFRFLLNKYDLKISYVLKYNTVLRAWSSDLYYTPNSCIQMYMKNIAGTPRFITYTHESIGGSDLSVYTQLNHIYVFNDDEQIITVDGNTINANEPDKITVTDNTLVFAFNASAYVIKPWILTEDIDGTVDTYITNEKLINKQFIDTGYRNLQITNKKRMREIQIKINDKLAVPLEFKTGFIMDNRRRVNIGSYILTPIDDSALQICPTRHTSHTSSTAVFEDEPDINDNVFSLSQSNLSIHDVATVRWKVSGKGYLPRMQLLSENKKSYEITGIGWIARSMNAR